MTGVLESVFGVVAIKACVAVALAVAAALAGRWVERPALSHALWVLVLLELLVPPVLEVDVLPRSGPFPESVTAIGQAVVDTPSSQQPATAGSVPETPASSFPWSTALAAVWMAGAVGLLLLAVVRVRRFGRLLSGAGNAPIAMTEMGARLATRLGLVRCPRIRVVSAAISPMLWPRLGSLEVLFPAALIPRLTKHECEALLAHELAHVRRRDHVVRWVELVATAAFWWHPVVWFARRRMRRAEELCCDGLVLAVLPDHARDYANGLVKTVEFLAPSRRGLPALASGIGGAKILEERLTMIMNRRPKLLSRPLRLTLALAAAGLLLVLPTWAEIDPDEAAESREREEQFAENVAIVREEVLALEARARELEHDLQGIRARQRELELDLQRQLGRAGRSADDAERAEQRRHREDEWLREQIELEAELDRREADEMRALAELESRLLAKQRAFERSASGDRERAEELEYEARELELLREELAHRSRHFEEERAAHTLDRMHEERARLEAQGRHEEALELERELAEAQRAMELAARHSLREDRVRALQEELESMVLQAEQLEAEGLHRAARDLERQIDQIRRALEAQRAEGD